MKALILGFDDVDAFSSSLLDEAAAEIQSIWKGQYGDRHESGEVDPNGRKLWRS
jgi:hypothetical protein